MAHRITLVGKGDFLQQDGHTLLAAGREAGFGFPQACRNGNCEKCAVQLVAGRIQAQRQLLAGYYPDSPHILPCICQALTDCIIEAPTVTAPGEIRPQKAACRLLDHQPLGPSVEEIRLQLPAGKKFHWHAGQYLLLENPQDHSVSAFSIANACLEGSRELVLHLRHGAENPSSQALLHCLSTESLFRVELPFGSRCLTFKPERPLWLLAGSTGFAPVQAMLQQLQHWHFALPVRCYRGAVRADDLYQSRESLALARWPSITWVEAVEHDPQPPQFPGRLVEAVCRDLALEKALFQQQGWPLAFIGGSPAMAWATFDALVAEGWPPELIHSDVFDYAPRP